MKHPKDHRDSLVLKPGEGRVYKCGIMTAVFKAASLLIGEQWIRADKGTFIRIPAKTMHDFKNQTNERTGLLNFFIPGGFERNMPSIVKWFDDQKAN